MVYLNSCNIMDLSKSKHDGLASVLFNIFPQRVIFAHNIYLSHCGIGIRLPLIGLLYHIRCCISSFSLLSTDFPADVKICKEMHLGNPVNTSDLQAGDFPVPKQTVSQLCADSQYVAHLINAQNIRIFFEHQLICVPLLYYRRVVHRNHLLRFMFYLRQKDEQNRLKVLLIVFAVKDLLIKQPRRNISYRIVFCSAVIDAAVLLHFELL